MHEILEFPGLLRLIDERSTAFRSAIASAPSLDVRVPTCPEWTLLDLVRHLGEGRRAWAATITAGPDATAKAAPEGAPAMPQDREALLAWLAASTQELLDALREAGPERGCWTWWGSSQSPRTCGAVARHQLQEIAVHTYDAQLTVGAPEPLPEEVALDGAEEFLSTCCTTRSAWPYEPTAFDFHATEDRTWRLTTDGDGARVARVPAPGTTPAAAVGASVHGTASDLVLFMYDRIPLASMKTEGDPALIDRLRGWEFEG
ncbi:maleylpyruvate isomerase family mycothiol-dependent enzyme [Streptomyces sp. NBC_00536]|uniref:maleylpyruvate isomerase family mycothiol-dependent enzyme n=1 Tax=Streptomyces sp. NBC_00536 TaxID=2975769 RepID=UPI002E80EED3|nr:maleylpyruvate isomerase family mycothiol-dependent enzyme [Streptomyces sp. NBC_00536]WUC77062.1 maleylpyruvate isomerase family mycothiol-dependent enzyme [Streptomyces sp. NBC_00536]